MKVDDERFNMWSVELDQYKDLSNLKSKDVFCTSKTPFNIDGSVNKGVCPRRLYIDSIDVT